MNSTNIKSIAVDKLLAAAAPKSPVDSLATGIDLEAYRRRRMAAVPGTSVWRTHDGTLAHGVVQAMGQTMRHI